MTMGELIRYHRERLELSQEELGNKLDPPVKKAAINKWEKGTVENIKRTHIQQLARLFELSPCELMSFGSEQASNHEQNELIELFQSLNEEGQKEVLKYIAYIASQDEYSSVKKESYNAKAIS